MLFRSLNRVIKIKYEDGSESNHNTGLMQFGQSRDFVMNLDKKPVQVSIDDQIIVPTMGVISELAHFRFGLLNKLSHCIAHEGASDFAAFHAKYVASTNTDIKEMLRDINPARGDDEGQISMAPRYWQKWGKHYTRAYYNAQNNQFCMNFKDPGLQIYGGELFHALQDIGDKIFAALPALEPTGNAPPPTPTTNYGARNVAHHAIIGGGGGGGGNPPPIAPAPIPMNQVFYNTGGGCWAPGTLVRMADDSFTAIENIRAGMMVWSKDGPAHVDYSLVLGTYMPTQVMCKIGNLMITPWHPILYCNAWIRPADIEKIEEHVMPVVYNMILNKGHIIEVDGILSCTLGHGIDGAVIGHDFFGNREMVIRDLMNQPGFDEKRPIFKNLKVRKDPVSNDICGWYDDV